METLYWCNEDDKVYTLAEIKKDYPEFRNEYETFGEYLNGCMYWNNGALYPLRDRVNVLQMEYNRKLAIGQKYGYELVDDELSELKEELDNFKRLYSEC